MNTREHHQFQEIKKWDAELHDAAQAFKREYGHFPNILLASDKTYSSIENAANVVAPQNFFGLKGKKVIQKPFSEVGGLQAFSTSNYKLEFCVDNKIPFSGYALVRDTNALLEDPVK